MKPNDGKALKFRKKEGCLRIYEIHDGSAITILFNTILGASLPTLYHVL